MRHMNEERSSVIDAIHYDNQDSKLRVRFKSSKLWYEKTIDAPTAEEAFFRFLTPETGSFGKWARSVKLFFDMKVGYQD